MDAIVEDKFSLMEILRNFTMYANVGLVSTQLLPNSRRLSVTIHFHNQRTLRKAVWRLLAALLLTVRQLWCFAVSL